jgi:hypothetical protein
MEKPSITLPNLAAGEIYIATLFDAESQQGHHIILLPGDSDDASWEKQTEWAKSIGGELPTRVEQSLLWAKHRDEFKKDWYWSGEQHESDAGYAWCQDFDNGYQDNLTVNLELRARAVRRLPI